VLVALGAPVADPLVGLAITCLILKITWDSWRTIRHAEIDVAHVEIDVAPPRRLR
jgi:divalent metal cation (Fe/Co/Zn/Cd) transporter